MLGFTICFSCVHFRVGGTCAAFPAGIPGAIMNGGYDHRQPYPDDNGILYEMAPGQEEQLAHYERTLAKLGPPPPPDPTQPSPPANDPHRTFW